MDYGESIFIKCDCGGCNVLELNYDDEFGQFNFAVWVAHPGEKPLSKEERIRWCDNVMKTGRPWADHTIVTKKEAQRIVNFIHKQLTHGKTKTDRRSSGRTRNSSNGDKRD